MTSDPGDNSSSVLQRWWQRPQRQPLRRALFQVHLWSGIGLGLYIFFISVTGSVLVYRNELYVMVTPEPYVSTAPGPVLSDSVLIAEAMRAHPGYRVTRVDRHYLSDHATEVWLARGDKTIRRHFDPHTGADVGKATATGVMLVSGLIQIHDNFLAGPKGRVVNGFGAMAVILVALTGLVLWWPGASRWQRSLVVHRGLGWKRFNWELHSMVGFWSFGAILVFSLSGIYLCFPETFHAWADEIQPLTAENAGERFIDKLLYWLAFLHFGRINGIGIPCDGPGLCDQSVKAVWALFGLAPAAMFVTGTIMWWNRVLRRYL